MCALHVAHTFERQRWSYGPTIKLDLNKNFTRARTSLYYVCSRGCLLFTCFTEMAESSNGEVVGEDVPATKTEDRGGDGEHTEDYAKLLEYGLDIKVCIKIYSFLNYY